jgi:hypothetical protein
MRETTTTTMPADASVDVVPPTATDLLVETWFVETFHNQGYDAPLFNRFRAAAEVLKARLRSTKE